MASRSSSLRAKLASHGVNTTGLLERQECEAALASAQYYADGGADAHAVCSTCGSGDDSEGNEILLCDGKRCPVAMHMRCLHPPLTTVPVGQWLCPACSAAAQGTAAEKEIGAMSVNAIKLELVRHGATPRGVLEKRELIAALAAARARAASLSAETGTAASSPSPSTPVSTRGTGSSSPGGGSLDATRAVLEGWAKQAKAREAAARVAADAKAKLQLEAEGSTSTGTGLGEAIGGSVETAAAVASDAVKEKTPVADKKKKRAAPPDAAPHNRNKPPMQPAAAEPEASAAPAASDDGPTADVPAANALDSAPPARKRARQSAKAGTSQDEPEAARGAAVDVASFDADALVAGIRQVVADGDLNTLTNKSVRTALEQRLGLRTGALAARKTEVNALIDKVVDERQTNAASEAASAAQAASAAVPVVSDGGTLPVSPLVPVTIKLVSGDVPVVHVPRKRVASLEVLARGLAKALPALDVPDAAQLADFKFKYAVDADGDNFEKLDPTDSSALSRAAETAHRIFAWPRKPKNGS